jgi:hypothetical protein
LRLPPLSLAALFKLTQYRIFSFFRSRNPGGPVIVRETGALSFRTDRTGKRCGLDGAATVPSRQGSSIGGIGVGPPRRKRPRELAATTKLGKIQRPQMGSIQRPLTPFICAAVTGRATSTVSPRPGGSNRVCGAGYATSTGSAGHAPASAAASSELTFHLDHSMGADHSPQRSRGEVACSRPHGRRATDSHQLHATRWWQADQSDFRADHASEGTLAL